MKKRRHLSIYQSLDHFRKNASIDPSSIGINMTFLFIYVPIFLVLRLLTRHIFHKIQNLPPSPILCLPIIGHLYLLKRPLHRTLSRISGRLGPVFFLQLGSRPSVVVSSPSAAEECLAKNDVVFANRPNLMMGRIMAYNYTSLAWASSWRNLRRISSLELLSAHRLNNLAGIRWDEVKSLIHRLITIKKQSQNDDYDRIVNLREGFVELTQNSMMVMIAGKRYYSDSTEDLEEAKTFLEIQTETIRVSSQSNLGDYLPIIRWVGGDKGLENDMEEVQRKRDGFMQSLIEEHKRKMETPEIDCRLRSKEGVRTSLIEVLLSLQRTEPDYYTDEIIRGLMLCRTDTSVNAIEWAFSLVLNHAEVLRKAQAEIDRHVGNDRLLDESDLPQLRYIQGIITETLRIYPPVPSLVPHESSEDCVVRGFRVPRGTTLFVNAWAIQNDPSVWVDPTSFRPERFVEFVGPRDGLRWMPFGSGRRACPGEGLAIRMIGLTLGSLIQCFDWKRPSKELIDMPEGVGITMPKAKPLRAKRSPRPTMLKLLSDQFGSIVVT